MRREQALGAGLEKLAHAMGAQVEADADHAAIGERGELALGYAGGDERDAP